MISDKIPNLKLLEYNEPDYDVNYDLTILLPALIFTGIAVSLLSFIDGDPSQSTNPTLFLRLMGFLGITMIVLEGVRVGLLRTYNEIQQERNGPTLGDNLEDSIWNSLNLLIAAYLATINAIIENLLIFMALIILIAVAVIEKYELRGSWDERIFVFLYMLLPLIFAAIMPSSIANSYDIQSLATFVFPFVAALVIAIIYDKATVVAHMYDDIID